MSTKVICRLHKGSPAYDWYEQVSEDWFLRHEEPFVAMAIASECGRRSECSTSLEVIAKMSGFSTLQTRCAINRLVMRGHLMILLDPNDSEPCFRLIWKGRANE